ncbi:MAG: hypothetical protein ABSA78_17235, partial [Candidatus Sulfotelmatobacter sp.]
ISHPGSSITTSTARMVVSVTLRPSAGLLHRVQRLDRSQLAHLCRHDNNLGCPSFAGFAKLGTTAHGIHASDET